MWFSTTSRRHDVSSTTHDVHLLLPTNYPSVYIKPPSTLSLVLTSYLSTILFTSSPFHFHPSGSHPLITTNHPHPDVQKAVRSEFLGFRLNLRDYHHMFLMKVSGLKDEMNGRGTFYVVRLKNNRKTVEERHLMCHIYKKSIFLVSILLWGDRSLSFPLINGICRVLQSGEFKEKM